VDGHKVANVNLYSSKGHQRDVVLRRSRSHDHSHRMVRVLGRKNPASSGKWADVDAFIVLR
jgi:hypothetical protein